MDKKNHTCINECRRYEHTQKRLEIIIIIRDLNADIARIQDTRDVITAKSQLEGYVVCQGTAKGQTKHKKIQTNHRPHTLLTEKRKISKRKAGWRYHSKKLTPICYKSRIPNRTNNDNAY